MDARGDLVWVSKVSGTPIICEPTPSNICIRRVKMRFFSQLPPSVNVDCDTRVFAINAKCCNNIILFIPLLQSLGVYIYTLILLEKRGSGNHAIRIF
jgi:hypothetical protein